MKIDEQQWREMEMKFGSMTRAMEDVSSTMRSSAVAIQAIARALGEWWEASGLGEIDWEELNQIDD